jgi:hypothetical protein
MKMGFDVIDKQTGGKTDWKQLRQIALTEQWAENLVYSDIDCFALDQDGCLMLLDECGNYAYPPEDRFEIRHHGEYDGESQTFWLLNAFLQEFIEAQKLPYFDLTKEAGQTIHKHAKKIARELIDGDYQ